MSQSKKIPNDIDSRIWKEYCPAPKLFTIHEKDPDLQPIDIPLPSPPPLYRIDGYGLPAKDQKFKRYTIPVKLQEIQSHATNLNDYWKKIEDKWWELQPEINWIRKMQYFRMHGYWFFNHGVPTNITGPHFNYLNFLKLNVGSPHYRYRSYLHFHIMQWAHDYTFDFKDVLFDRHGDRMPNKYGDELIDTLERKIYGLLEPKFRRCGFTSEDLAWILLRIQTYMYRYSGLQNFTGKKAKDLWDKFVFLWRKQPMFLMPIWTGDTNPASQIWFQKKGSMEMTDSFGIESHIDFATTANSAAYDGEELLDYLRDEGGKCFGLGTPIMMFDGSTKKVEDVSIGDQVMGPDSKPRNVLKLGRGREMMYTVIPHKGDSWRCNESHLLVLKVCTTRSKFLKKGDIKIIPVRDYIQMAYSAQKHTMLMKTGVEFSEIKHEIDPYLLGVWLGDGNADCTGICSADKEIVDYLKNWASDRQLQLRQSSYQDIVYYITRTMGASIRVLKNGVFDQDFDNAKLAADYVGLSNTNILRHIKNGTKSNKGYSFERTSAQKNLFLTFLQKNNLIKNKHIPNNYLIDSRENRLELLAGLIDTDGSFDNRGGVKYDYEITQVRGNLAIQIKWLAESLGFYCSLFPKKTSMKRKDGTYYRGIAYRLNIYGKTLYEIPCKVKRKKIIDQVYSKGSKGRNPMSFGFEIKPDCVDNYYGFTLDGDHKFLLGDFTVVHNTIEDDLYQGWDVVKNTLAWGSGKILRGFALFPTTVGEFEKKGGENFYYMVRDSDLYQRTPNGNTKTGLVTTFLPADEGMPGFIDEWGNSMKKEAREHLLNEREHYLHVGTPEAIQKYNESCRLFPLYLAEAFITKNKVTGFNSVILNTRIKELRFSDEGVPGNLEWVNGIKYGKIYRNPCPEGRWIFYKDFPEDRSNPIYRSDEGYYSKNTKEVMHNADPFNFDEVEGKRESNGGIVGIERRMSGSDDTSDIKKWELPLLLYYYCFRPKRVEDFAEDCLKTVWYYGGMMNNEVNNPGVKTWFKKWNCAGLLYYYWNEDGTKRDTPGYSKVGATGNRILLSAANFVELHGHRIPSIKLLENCRDLRGVKDLTNKDDVAAFAGCTDAIDNDYRSELPPPKDNDFGIGDYFQVRSYGR